MIHITEQRSTSEQYHIPDIDQNRVHSSLIYELMPIVNFDINFKSSVPWVDVKLPDTIRTSTAPKFNNFYIFI